MTQSLRNRYPVFAESTIRRWVAREEQKYRDAKITKYVPILVQRSLESTLRDLAH